LNKLQKIQAFTLGELLVVMVISSIVVTLSFLALENVQRQVRLINQTFDKQQKILKFERLLTNDLYAMEGSLDLTKNQLIFQRAMDTFRYTFQDKQIIRQEDTIALQVEKKTFYLEGEKVTSGPFDAMELTFSDTYNGQGFFLYRKHDASYYMNE
jgi:prepilin-type N-terminal cleavage/methylation domain-containing protein